MTTTDDTRQRSIPDILGWERAPDDWGYTGPMWQHPDGGRCVDDRGGWTADDLLGWIQSRGWDFHAQGMRTYHDGHPLVGERRTKTITIDAGSKRQQFRAPTLLAALEAACRAVAEAES